jgi:succinyl-diaminopimelate desuccinylase
VGEIAVAIFSHLAAELARTPEQLHGRLLVLFDADEHTGGFGGARAFLAKHPEVAGAMIGIPAMTP